MEMYSDIEQQEELSTTLEILREDILMLRLMLFGLDEDRADPALSCLIRMSDYLNQHIQEVCTLSGNNQVPPRGRNPL
jgi:hypothetical protein